MTRPISCARIAAIQSLIALTQGAAPKPRPAELELIISRAKAGIDDLEFYYAHQDRLRSRIRPKCGSARDMMRKGDWIQTYTGVQFWPLDPRADEIQIEDIAHALSMQCRFSGHCLRFYSVAEHCVLLSRHVPRGDALWALLHDASEAYLVDIPRPIKPALGIYRELEASLMLRVCERFGISPEMPTSVHEADRAILTDEMRQNMSAAPAPWSTETSPLGVKLRYWSPARAEEEFLEEFTVLSARGEIVEPENAESGE
jgi:hypothetical protein